MNQSPVCNKKFYYTTVLLLIFTVFLTYSGIIDNGFVEFDDQAYIYENINLQKGFSWDSIRWAFSLDNPNLTYWHPLTWLSLMLDYQLFGLSAQGYHLVNVLLHSLNSIFLFSILRRATGRFWPSVFVAALFAMHPLNVESVAWAVERKTVLCTFFWFLTIRIYLSYASRPTLGRYILMTVTFSLGLLSKALVITLPFVLLLLDIWPLGRLKGWQPATPDQGAGGGSVNASGQNKLLLGKLLLEKLPLLLPMAFVLTATIYSNRVLMHFADNSSSMFGYKVSAALVSYVAYIGKMFYPINLAVFYPPPENYSALQVASAGTVLLIVTLLVLWHARRLPWLMVGWFWYLGVLFPVSGLVRSGLWPAMADRFTYLPMIGIIIIVVWGMAELMEYFPRCWGVFTSVFCFVLVALMIISHRQVRYWKDTVTLFEHAAAVTTDNNVAYSNLGFCLLDRKDYEKGYAFLLREQKTDPFNIDYEYAHAFYNVSSDLSSAEAWLQKGLSKNEDDLPLLTVSSEILEKRGETEKVIQTLGKIVRSTQPDGKGYKRAALKKLNRLLSGYLPQLELLRAKSIAEPDNLALHAALAIRLDELGLYEEAEGQYFELERRGDNSWQLFYNMANVKKKLSRFQSAADYYEKSLALNPVNVDALNNLGIVFRALNQPEKSKQAFVRAIGIDPRFNFAPFQLALTFLKQKDQANALRWFKYVRERFPDMAENVDPYLTMLSREKR